MLLRALPLIDIELLKSNWREDGSRQPLFEHHSKPPALGIHFVELAPVALYYIIAILDYMILDHIIYYALKRIPLMLGRLRSEADGVLLAPGIQKRHVPNASRDGAAAKFRGCCDSLKFASDLHPSCWAEHTKLLSREAPEEGWPRWLRV